MFGQPNEWGLPPLLTKNQLILAAWAPAACWRNPGCCKNGLGQWSASFLHTKKLFLFIWTVKFYFYTHLNILLKLQKKFGIDRMIFSGLISDKHLGGRYIDPWRRAPKVCPKCYKLYASFLYLSNYLTDTFLCPKGGMWWGGGGRRHVVRRRDVVRRREEEGCGEEEGGGGMWLYGWNWIIGIFNI